MPSTQQIPNTRIPAGASTFDFGNSATGDSNAAVTIDRTVNGGLNSLTTADTLTIAIYRSFDGGTTWEPNPKAAITCVGGTIVVKGTTISTEFLAVGIDGVTDFRVVTTASKAVRIAGTVVYS